MMLHMSQKVLADLGRGELSLLDDRLAEADEGEMICASHIEEWVGSWFTDGELPPPAPLPLDEV
jgi:hypothetical protein